MRYYRCFDVKPGMTRFQAVKGRTDPCFESRIAPDFETIRDRSVRLDVEIILRTPVALFKEKGQ